MGGQQFHLHVYVGGREQVGRPCKNNAWAILEHSVWVLYVGGIQCNPEWMVARNLWMKQPHSSVGVLNEKKLGFFSLEVTSALTGSSICLCAQLWNEVR